MGAHLSIVPTWVPHNLRPALVSRQHKKMDVLSCLPKTGLTGKVVLDEKGDRVPAFKLVNIHNGVMEKIGDYDATKHIGGGTYINDTAIFDVDQFFFPGNTNEVPKDSPPCGFDQQLCIGKPFAQLLIRIAKI